MGDSSWKMHQPLLAVAALGALGLICIWHTNFGACNEGGRNINRISNAKLVEYALERHGGNLKGIIKRNVANSNAQSAEVVRIWGFVIGNRIRSRWLSSYFFDYGVSAFVSMATQTRDGFYEYNFALSRCGELVFDEMYNMSELRSHLPREFEGHALKIEE
jgi:hypothetical protein